MRCVPAGLCVSVCGLPIGLRDSLPGATVRWVPLCVSECVAVRVSPLWQALTDASTREQVVEFVKRVLGDDSAECAFVLDVVGKVGLMGGRVFRIAMQTASDFRNFCTQVEPSRNLTTAEATAIWQQLVLAGKYLRHSTCIRGVDHCVAAATNGCACMNLYAWRYGGSWPA